MSATTYVLWGRHARYADGAPIKLEIGNLRECRAESRYRQGLGGWILGIYRHGDEPTGLALQEIGR